MTDPARFIETSTALVAPPLVPEILLHLAVEVVPLWRKTEEELAIEGVPPPYWAFAWAGGQALARYLIDHPTLVRGKTVLDFGSGSGLVACAAARAGARKTVAADIDRFAATAIAMNAMANDVVVEVEQRDIVGTECDWQVMLCGDMCYERPLADRLLSWLALCARQGAQVYLGDPGRSYFPKSGVERLATYNVATTRELEDREIRETSVYRLLI
jgi:predicted nicotinamide N-methyase